ncbi:MAG: hypothetical protein WCE30_10005 [Mycobacterium sp.]
MADNRVRTPGVLAVVAAARVGVGIAMVAAPRLLFRTETGAETLLMRTIGIRDMAIGLGGCVAMAKGDTEAARLWAGAGAFSDTADTVTGLFSRDLVGSRGAAIATITPLPFVLAGIFGLTRGRRNAQ